MSVRVAKFGGSSLSDAAQFHKVKAIVESNCERHYIIASAPGRNEEFNLKVTDQLVSLTKIKAAGNDYLPLLQQIRNRYQLIVDGLPIHFPLERRFEELEKRIESGASDAYIISRGEALNAEILAAYLGFDYIDAADCIYFDGKGVFESETTYSNMRQLLKKHEYAVLPGFYGSNPDGEIALFSRGGSDISGAIVARAVSASLYENWTDVNGVLMADPRCVPNPKTIPEITYRELRELAYMGASVLHDEAISPVRYVGIPIHIRNTNVPEHPGTLIVPNRETGKRNGSITGIAGRLGFTSITVEKELMNTEIGFGRKVLSAIEESGLCFEHLPSGIDTLSVIVNTHNFKPLRSKIVSDIVRMSDPDALLIEEHLALISVVGSGMIRARGTAAKLFTALADAGINIRLIDQGSSEISIIIGVEEKDYVASVTAIYSAFSKI